MWLTFAVLHLFFMAIVNYLDEYLTHSSSSKQNTSIHQRIGGVLLVSCLLLTFGISIIALYSGTIIIPTNDLILSLLSSITLIAVWIGYFYLFQNYSAHQVVPLFGLSSIWLLCFELGSGETMTLTAFIGIITLILGAYLLDNGSLKLKFPTKLVFWMSLLSLSWAVTILLTKQATQNAPATLVYFWQSVGIFAIGILMLAFIKPYRHGLLQRLKHEKYKFIGLGIFSESCAQLSFWFGIISISLAPMAVYFSATGGIGNIFLLLLLRFFPLDKRNIINNAQWIGIGCIAIGIATLELGR